MNTELPKVKTQLFIDGNWQDGSLQKTKAVDNPATGEIIAQVAQAEMEDTKRAIEAAQKAFPKWREMELRDRVELLHRVACLLEENADRLAKIMTIEQGKPVAEAKAEILTGAENFRFNAEEARRIYGETIPAPNKRVYIVKKEPIGVVAAITPWNFPMGMATRKLAPALAAGNTVILKPSSETPLSALALFEIFEEAGFPRGVVNLLLGNSSEIGEALTTSDAVRKLTFTGSTAVGQKLYQESGETLKKISLELGGHAPFIVFSDANLVSAADGLVAAKFRNNGQVCVSPNRIFVAKEVEQEFIKLVLERVQKLKVGNGLQEGVNAGPLIREDAIRKIDRQLKDAAEKGADILLGGERLLGEGYDQGNFFAPTVLTGVTEQMRIFHEETFGPVIPIISFVADDEVVKLANDSEFGLASYFYTENLERVEEISNALEYGMVGVNDMAISHPETPFGGVKHSGFGRENGHFGIEEYLNVKFVALKYRQ
ncbi:NAD-dependent succinate-semialdehyde dehydrogenase [Listeria aquatica]|uniref:NAD-dependent succinate-semialdehyde dehydrogenase n=1 Tax=Listeria aquatica TaxID=1494960 RepID=A0A841ZJQ1_9LIST|nr:NAD-dependent succinate-semialdehyde dehydrogenase [Listeria aquatica]MBC1520303.1 NAD-dependent succinate-semialdehyde dehydrogenase [Listeria aquatica]